MTAPCFAIYLITPSLLNLSFKCWKYECPFICIIVTPNFWEPLQQFRNDSLQEISFVRLSPLLDTKTNFEILDLFNSKDNSKYKILKHFWDNYYELNYSKYYQNYHWIDIRQV